MTVNLNITHMQGFLSVIDRCTGAVRVCGAHEKINIRQNPIAQVDLMRSYLEGKRFLSLCLEIQHPRDYLDIVCFSVGNF